MDYLREKWQLWYQALDVNHDGKLTMDDVDISRRQFANLHGLDKNTSSMTQQDITSWWTTYIFRGHQPEISLDDFLGMNEKAYREDKEKFIKDMTACFTQVFGIIDTNHDRNISEEEFLIAYKAYGHGDVDGQRQMFKLYQPENGFVPLGRIVGTWVQFVTCEDRNVPDIIKDACEKGV